jgi:hypothetical protein
MRNRLLLAAWLAGILFPMAWLGRYSDRYKTLFNELFSSELVHYGMHTILFAGLAALLVVSFNLQRSGPRAASKTVALVLLVSLGIGGIQEGLQLISGVQILRLNTLLDLGIDMAGALTGCLLTLIVCKAHPDHSSPVTKSRA